MCNDNLNTTKKIRVLTLRFDQAISTDEVPLWRGAVIARPDMPDVLFHNHTGDTTYRYSYPLIQYKRIGGKAAIVSVDEGTDVIGQFLANCGDNIYRLGNRCVRMEVEEVRPSQMLMQTWDSRFSYTLRRWLPLNSDNYRRYQAAGDAERMVLLEGILRGNLLSMCKGLGIYLDRELLVKITSMERPRIVTHKGTRLMAFDIEFATNLSIPNFVGIGKSASLGYGTIHEKRKRKTI